MRTVRTRLVVLLLAGGVSAVLIVAIIAVTGLRLRAHLVVLHATGQLRDVELSELLGFMRPGSPVQLARLVDTRNPYSAVENDRTTATDVESGGKLFRAHCAVCHAPDGSGGPAAPPLIGRTLKIGDSDWAIYRTIRLGVPGTAMPRHALPDTSIWQLVAFVRSIDRPGTVAPDAVGPAALLSVDLTYAALAAIRHPTDEWLTHSGSYASSRHSTLSHMDPSNVGQLAVRWIHQFEGAPQMIQASPLVRQGIMFTTVPPGRVMALDASTGKQLWVYEHRISGTVRGNEFGGLQNRGVALLGDKVFVATVDAHLVALSTKTGAVQWNTEVSSDRDRYYITAAPLAYRDLVVTGVGTRGGGRGFIAAYDINTGKQRWRFATIPGPGEPGNETWAGDSWREGGAPTWVTGSYDAELDLLIWGIGNPKPDYDPASRQGDNLYSNSVVGLRGSTGQLIWHFQFTPADHRDWDACQTPVLADRTVAGKTKRLLLWANHNAFYYVLNRETGTFMTAAPFAHQTWTDGIDSRGRPKTDSLGHREGSLQYPGNMGATNWWSPSLDPVRGLMFVPVLEQGMVYYGSSSSWPTGSSRAFYTAVRALDAWTGKRVWEYARSPRRVDNRIGGVLSTKTGLVFGGDQTTFFALDSRTGTELWSMETGGKIYAAPITYMSHEEQFVVIAAGRSLLALALPRTTARGRP